MKIFVTGDNHIGLKFNRYPQVKDRLVESRYDSMEKMVKTAEDEQCDIFVVTGDLFERINASKKEVERVVNILAKFNRDVFVLPGNHDYYTGEEQVWIYFNEAVSKCNNNIKLITEMKEFTVDIDDQTVGIYPAFCQSKHSGQNNLDWIKSMDINVSRFNIGIAHGNIDGVSPDMTDNYFNMEKDELYKIPVDVWLMGHAHISYPELPADRYVTGHKIFNPGTHEQTDLSNNTEGCAFIISLEMNNGEKTVSARRVITGNVRFYDIHVDVNAEMGLGGSIENALKDIENKENSVLRLTLSGAVNADEYYNRSEIYESTLDGYMDHECVDSELSELITKEKIRDEFPEISFAAQLLESLDDPKEVQMAYELIKACRQ